MKWVNKIVTLFVCLGLIMFNSCSKDEDNIVSVYGSWCYTDDSGEWDLILHYIGEKTYTTRKELYRFKEYGEYTQVGIFYNEGNVVHSYVEKGSYLLTEHQLVLLTENTTCSYDYFVTKNELRLTNKGGWSNSYSKVSDSFFGKILETIDD